MKKQYIDPEIEVIEFNAEEVILTASGDVDIDPWSIDGLENG